MNATFFLVRHAAHDNLGGYLAGREVDVSLGEAGLQQAERVANRMSRDTFRTLRSSPRRRTQQTAAAIAAATGVQSTVAKDLDEIDFGREWCGRSFADLGSDPRWREWNADRASARSPGGESLGDVQERIVAYIEAARKSAELPAALVTHADVIKVAVAYYIGLPLTAIDRFDVAPGSISALVIGDWGAKLLWLNETPQ
jgi:broad specificity phosphatase PhoE